MLIFLLVAEIAIFSGNNQRIVGSWSNGNGTVVFDSHGNYMMDGDMELGTYEGSDS